MSQKETATVKYHIKSEQPINKCVSRHSYLIKILFVTSCLNMNISDTIIFNSGCIVKDISETNTNYNRGT